MERLSIVGGMQVLAPNGRRMGVVRRCGAEHMLVADRFPSRKRCAIAYSSIRDLKGGKITLKKGLADLLDPEQPDLLDGVLTHTKPIGPRGPG